MVTLNRQISLTMPNHCFTSDNENSDCFMFELKTSSVLDVNSYDLGDCYIPIPSLDFFSTEYSALKKTALTMPSINSLSIAVVLKWCARAHWCALEGGQVRF